MTIAFTPEASARFADATTRHVHRRIAILLDGVVQSAPEIREPISGGTARITMGAGDSETQRADAKALILSLEAGRSPPP